jgi:hypothetical protein
MQVPSSRQNGATPFRSRQVRWGMRLCATRRGFRAIAGIAGTGIIATGIDITAIAAISSSFKF